MKHLKDSCSAHHMIIGNNCGLVCSNCFACKCGGKLEASVSSSAEEKTLGIEIAERFKWDGVAIMSVFKTALSEANFHTEAKQVEKMIADTIAY